MSYSKYQYTILCEDIPQSHFVRGWLVERGAIDRKISIDMMPGEEGGSGKEYVRNYFKSAQKKLRRRPEHSILIVVMDADNLSPEEAEKKFLAASAPDKIFFIVPHWHIETWARWLSKQSDPESCKEPESRRESVLCKNRYKNAKFGKLGKHLSQLMKGMSPDDPPPMPASLHRAISHVQQKRSAT